MKTSFILSCLWVGAFGFEAFATNEIPYNLQTNTNALPSNVVVRLGPQIPQTPGAPTAPPSSPGYTTNFLGLADNATLARLSQPEGKSTIFGKYFCENPFVSTIFLAEKPWLQT